jgi:hypothetical protein
MPISRLYDTPATAESAATALTTAGFRVEIVHVVAAPVTAAAIVEYGIAPAPAAHYAARIAAGAGLLVVDAPMYTGATATAIMEQAHPVEPGLSDITYHPLPRNRAAPLSSALNLPVLSANPTPLSSYFKWTILSADQKPKAKLAKKIAPLSSLIKMPTLSGNPAPLSSWLKWKLFWGGPTPLSTKIGMTVLLDDAAPLSKRAGMGVLKSNPAPLSSMLGLPVLIKHR